MKYAKQIVKHRIGILLLSIFLLIPSIYGYMHTRINYDILSYLPSQIDTMKGQQILQEEFGKGAFAFAITKGMTDSEILNLQKQIEQVDGVAKVISYPSLTNNRIPKEILPEKVIENFQQGDASLIAIFFKQSTSHDQTIHAVNQIRALTKQQAFLSSMSCLVSDIEELSKSEMSAYVIIAVLLTSLVIAIFMDSWLIPILFMSSIGLSIVFNLGSNIFLHQISYITKSLTAVLQLGVTLDYSIFLWHSFKEHVQQTNKEDAMAKAIQETFSSIVGGSTTTIAGFIALCFMTFTLGKDMGIVMAKGVLIGVITCLTILPSLILICYTGIVKTSHRPWIPKTDTLSHLIIHFRKVILGLFIVLLPISYYLSNHTPVYYNLDKTLPKSLPSIQANTMLKERFGVSATHMILVDRQIDPSNMVEEIKQLNGIQYVISAKQWIPSFIPEDFLNDVELYSQNHQLILVQSTYQVASPQVNEQCQKINQIIKEYDTNAMLIGEAPCTYDLIHITDHDFQTVSLISMALIFLIILISFKKPFIPIILVTTIQFAIFINMGIPYLTHTELPFIASIVIGTIQLGATVDYAILMTTRYMKQRQTLDRKQAIQDSLSHSIPSILVSALGFFSATFGVGVYSHIDMISALCSLLAKGAIISMIVVITVLPTLLYYFDPILFRKKEHHA